MSPASYQHCHYYLIQSPNILLKYSEENEILNLISSHPLNITKESGSVVKSIYCFARKSGFCYSTYPVTHNLLEL